MRGPREAKKGGRERGKVKGNGVPWEEENLAVGTTWLVLLQRVLLPGLRAPPLEVMLLLPLTCSSGGRICRGRASESGVGVEPSGAGGGEGRGGRSVSRVAASALLRLSIHREDPQPQDTPPSRPRPTAGLSTAVLPLQV